MADENVWKALALLEQAGRLDMLWPEALAPECMARWASAGVAAAVLACSPPRFVLLGSQVRRGRGLREGRGGEVRQGRVPGRPGGGRLGQRLRGSPGRRGALLCSLGPRARPAWRRREHMARRAVP
ncbi:hypothetical protein NDU88_000036 [Pleurodeles waltl]|uniref:Uncharacterized protein n=1 Tax=Pleurodeles waltl TaxID=8319 RepID=A0AAV7KP38_PLEWA|nr:hypothetical protein NDU88_000036 [Pleurodeles waltl]